jgi:hypothetical protein
VAAAGLIDRAARPIGSPVHSFRVAPTAFRHVMVHDADSERRSALPRRSSPSGVHRRPVPGGYGVSARGCCAAFVGVSPGHERRRGICQ